MGKIWSTIKSGWDLIYKWRQRSENLEKFLQDAAANHSALSTMNTSIINLNQGINDLEGKIDTLDGKVKDMNDQLNTISQGTKMELFETLHNMRDRLVVREGIATALDKKEAEEVFRLYHDSLGGNGQGERYYQEIIALPESKEEKEALNNV